MRQKLTRSEDIERPPPPPKILEQPFIPRLTRAPQMYSPKARANDNQSFLHPNAAELGHDIARPSTAASRMTGSTYLVEPVTAPRLRSFSSSSTLASTAYTISSDARSRETDKSLFLSGPPSPLFPRQESRLLYGTDLTQHQASSSANRIAKFGMRPQSFAYAPTYHTHHANFSVGSGISDTSLQSSKYSTLHQNVSEMSGFSELSAQSPRQERSCSNLAPKANNIYPWNHDPEADAPEVVPQPQPQPRTKTPTYVAYSAVRLPTLPPMPDYSIPEVVPVEHEGHFEALPQATTHAFFPPMKGVFAPQSQLQVPSQQPQRTLTQAQERREKTRARLNLIAGE